MVSLKLRSRRCRCCLASRITPELILLGKMCLDHLYCTNVQDQLRSPSPHVSHCHLTSNHLFVVLIGRLNVSATDVLPLTLENCQFVSSPEHSHTYASVDVIPQLVHALVVEATTSSVSCDSVFLARGIRTARRRNHQRRRPPAFGSFCGRKC